MLLAPKVVIFDFDGTIADTMPFLVDLAARLLRSRYGLADGEARQAYIETTGLPFSKQIEIIFPGNPLNEATVREFEGEKLSHLGDFAFFPDAPAVLAVIRKGGVKVCVSSGNYEGLIEEVLAARGLAVDLVMGFRPGFENGPQHFRFAAETFAAEREQVVFVGDSIKDGLAAREAGIGFIAKAGLVSAEDVRRRLPGVPVVGSLTEVLPLLGITIARRDPGTAASSRASTS
jgi:phosphoglycolate phosphatase